MPPSSTSLTPGPRFKNIFSEIGTVVVSRFFSRNLLMTSFIASLGLLVSKEPKPSLKPIRPPSAKPSSLISFKILIMLELSDILGS